MTIQRLAFGLGIAVGCLGAIPAAAVPRYEAVLLPDLGQGSRARGYLEAGPLAVAAGEVHDGGEIHAALWTRKGRKWQPHLLSDLGHGGSALTFELTPAGSHAQYSAAGTVQDANGTDIAAVWKLQRTRRGWTDTVHPLTAPGGPSSEAVHCMGDDPYIGGLPDAVTVVGRRGTGVPGEHRAAFWILDPIALTVTETLLPGLGGVNSEAVAGVVLPNGNMRILGSAEPPGAALASRGPHARSHFRGLGVEWIGNPQQGFTPAWLPEPAPGLESHQVLGADPRIRYAVGAQVLPGGAVAPAGWATFPWTVGVLTALLIPNLRDTSSRLTAVNSSGRAIGLCSDDAAPPGDLGSFTQLVNVREDGRKIWFAKVVSDDGRFNGFVASSIAPSGAVAGALPVPGGTRACLLLPTALHFPDFGQVVEGTPGAAATAVDDWWEDYPLFWDDTDVVRIHGAAPDEWLGLLLDIDLPGIISDKALPKFIVGARLDGPKGERARQDLCLWNFALNRWDLIHSLPIRGGKDQRLQHPLPANLAPYRSPTGSLRLELRWNGAGFPHPGPGYGVSVNSAAIAAELLLEDI